MFEGMLTPEMLVGPQDLHDNELRNQFANNFMLGYMIRNGCTIGQEDHVAKRALKMADAMLAASKEKTE